MALGSCSKESPRTQAHARYDPGLLSVGEDRGIKTILGVSLSLFLLFLLFCLSDSLICEGN